jgi:hypothetical protein
MEQGLRGVVAHVFAYGPVFTARAKAHGRHYLAFGRFYAASA